MKALNHIWCQCFTRPLFILLVSPICLPSVKGSCTPSWYSANWEIRNVLVGAVSQTWISVCALWPIYSQKFPLCSAAHSYRQKSTAHPSFYTGVSSRNSSFNSTTKATQIQQADSIQQLSLGLGAKESGLSSLYTTNNTALSFTREFIIPVGQGLGFLCLDPFQVGAAWCTRIVVWDNLVM